MTVPSLRSHIADVLVAKDFADGVMPDRFDADEVADALLADPTLAAIVRLAEQHVAECLDPTEWYALGPEVLGLLGWQEGTPR